MKIGLLTALKRMCYNNNFSDEIKNWIQFGDNVCNKGESTIIPAPYNMSSGVEYTNIGIIWELCVYRYGSYSYDPKYGCVKISECENCKKFLESLCKKK